MAKFNFRKAKKDVKNKVKDRKDKEITVADAQKRTVTLMCAGLASLLFLLGAGIYSNNKMSSNQAILANQQTQIAGIKNQISAKKAANNRAIEHATQEVSGLSLERRDQDKALAQKLFNLVCTWDNGQEYRKNRNKALSEYHINPNSNFADAFLPPLEQQGMRLGKSNGTNTIDEDNLNMRLNEIDLYVTGINGNTYSYFAVVHVSSHNKKGATADGTITATFDTIGGQIKHLDASANGYSGDE